LARNIYLNQLVDKVVKIPLPLSDSIKASRLNMTSTEWGAALSSFGEDYGHDGKALNKVFEFSLVGLSMDETVGLLKVPHPTHIKIDVDWIEHLILLGGQSVLNQIKEVLVEVNDDFHHSLTSVNNYLSAAGLSLKWKRHAAMYDSSEHFGKVYNQLWHRIK